MSTQRTDPRGRVVAAGPHALALLDHLDDIAARADHIVPAAYGAVLARNVRDAVKHLHAEPGDLARINSLAEATDVPAWRSFRWLLTVGPGDPADTEAVLAAGGWIDSPIILRKKEKRWRFTRGARDVVG